jgi:hypothetical protein
MPAASAATRSISIIIAARVCSAAADGHCEKREVSGREVCILAHVAIFPCGSELRLI